MGIFDLPKIGYYSIYCEFVDRPCIGHKCDFFRSVSKDNMAIGYCILIGDDCIFLKTQERK